MNDDKNQMGSGFGLLFAGLLMILISSGTLNDDPEYGALWFFGALLAGGAVCAIFNRFSR